MDPVNAAGRIERVALDRNDVLLTCLVGDRLVVFSKLKHNWHEDPWHWREEREPPTHTTTTRLLLCHGLGYCISTIPVVDPSFPQRSDPGLSLVGWCLWEEERGGAPSCVHGCNFAVHPSLLSVLLWMSNPGASLPPFHPLASTIPDEQAPHCPSVPLPLGTMMPITMLPQMSYAGYWCVLGGGWSFFNTTNTP